MTIAPPTSPARPPTPTPTCGSAPARRRILGWATALSLALTAVMALVVSPPDVNMQDSVRLLYLHVPTAWLAMYVSFGVTTLASVLYLWKRTRSPVLGPDRRRLGRDRRRLPGPDPASSGSIWGRITWGVWWAWDARLTTTAVLFVLYLGYLAVRRVPATPEVAAKRSAIVGVARLPRRPDRPLQSVEWWRTLHQDATFSRQRRLSTPDPRLDGFTLSWGVLAFTLLTAGSSPPLPAGRAARTASPTAELDRRRSTSGRAEGRRPPAPAALPRVARQAPPVATGLTRVTDAGYVFAGVRARSAAIAADHLTAARHTSTTAHGHEPPRSPTGGKAPMPGPPAPGRRGSGGASWRRSGFLALSRPSATPPATSSTADEAVAQRAQLGTRRFRIEGTSSPARSTRSDRTCRLHHRGKTSSPGRHSGRPARSCSRPASRRPRGHWDGDHFASDRILVKHSETTTTQHPDRLK